MARQMPVQKPGRSETVVETPLDFMQATKKFLDIKRFAYDLAASPENAKAVNYFTKEDNSLVQPWHQVLDTGQIGWLNPPYDNIRPWVAKCVEEVAYGGIRIAVLVPASTGSNWWRDYVDGQADIYLLNGRITFVGHSSPYPKDLALLLYGTEFADYTVWGWKATLREDNSK